MLIEFSVSNFKSYKNKETFSMLAESGTELFDSNVIKTHSVEDINLLSSAVIYGPNASGKSNLFEAMDTMIDLIIETRQRGDKLTVKPYAFDKNYTNKGTEFEIIFLVDNVRYQYGFEVTKERVLTEWLLSYPNKRPVNLFTREFINEKKGYEWNIGQALKGQKKLWQESTRSNALFLSTATMLNSEQLSKVFDYFDKKVRVIGSDGLSKNITDKLFSGGNDKSVLRDFLKSADFNIEDVKYEKHTIEDDDFPDDMPESMKEEIISDLRKMGLMETKFGHLDEDGGVKYLDFGEESSGTQRYYSFIGPWFYSLRNGFTLFVDELNENLHPLLVEFLVKLFNNPKTNKSGAQLIFSTHETAILSQEVFRRDQVWFSEKSSKGFSKLYSLSEFRVRKGVENVEKNYLSGKYGALPYFKDVMSIWE
ncbi:AAA family ATPase [Kangiella koreensis]|uniref:RloA protein n=1 Tax=Kangiella koreensis (strain DSM 16069 / JCM 12317 / KCTC 12182 / SW-125) TaxID=523791 RepID=C7R9E9_KANKD|nr:ATP-binding protein [Kangiella koreensis]ACV26040.1 RloA protein [Kangiella koreensis DSM 16069]